MRKNIYLAIASKLKTIVDDNNYPVIKHFDLWNNNIQFAHEENPYDTPAVFVEFPPIQWKYYPNGTREAVVRIRVHVVFRHTAPTHTESGYLDESLDYLDVLDKIQNTLSGYTIPGINPLTPVQSITNHNHDELFNCIEDFDLHVIDAQAVTEPAKIPASSMSIKIIK